MEVKPGYKHTDAGVVPEDWFEHTVGQLINFEGGSQPNKSVFSPSLKSGFVRLIQIRDYKTDKFETFVPRNLARRFCTENDIMIGRYGPPIFQILRGLAGAYNVALIKAKPHPEISRGYAYYFLTQERLFAFIERLSQRSSGQTGVDLKELRGYPFPLPPTKAEQEAIAEVLSDADALIESLEQLLAKKRQIKQGAMQELLTGKKRLPGFETKPRYKQTEVGVIPEDWEVKPLGSFAQFKNGYAFKSGTYTALGSFNIVTIANVQDGFMDITECNRISDLPRDIQPHHRLQLGDVLIAMTGNVGRVCRVTTTNCLLNQRVGKLIPSSVDAVFLFLLLGQQRFLTAMTGKAKGGAQGNLSVSDIIDFQFPLPPAKAEQEAMVTVLSDMAADLAALEEKLAKARQIKQGMMQELLTGRIRLV